MTPGIERTVDMAGGPLPACSGRRGARAPAHPGGASGFTLIEVLLATVLLAAGLALAFATLSAATRTARRGEVMAQHNERMRAVEGFLRRRIAGTRPVAFGFDQGAGLPQRFIGEPDRLRFVADLPDYLGRGGPYLHDFTIEQDDGKIRIALTLSQVQSSAVIQESTPVPPETLVDGLASAHFRYRALGDDGRLGEWSERWEKMEQLPMLVEVTMTDADGTPWPPLVVALRLAGSYSGSGQ